MKWKASSLAPALLCAGVTASICLLDILGAIHPGFSLFNRIEWITYDWRVREAVRHSPPVATNLGLVAMGDDSIDALLNGSLPYRFGLLWPRQVYARLVNELSAQGAKAIGFDVLFSEPRPDHPGAVIDGETIPSDEFFKRSLQRNGNVILATEGRLFPPPMLATNALAVAHISAQREADGILRRTHAFVEVRVWHPVIKEAAHAFGWNLDRVTTQSRELHFPREDESRNDTLPLDAEGRFNVGLLERAIAGNNMQPILSRFAAPFEDKRVWQLGIALAAHQLNLNLDQALVDLARGRIVLTNAQGIRRVIPVDRAGRFYINWSIPLNDPRLLKRPIEHLLAQHEARQAGHLDDITNEWAGKLILVGSTATGNNLSDHGATPLEQHTFLVSDYWNVANSVLMNHFVRPLDLPWRLLVIALLGALAGICTLKLKTLTALVAVALIGVAYSGTATALFISSRIWLPIVMPVGGALLCTHVCLITYLVRVERRGRRRTENIFSRVVSPDVVQELLGQEKLSLGGARRRVTVFFADVRGFTEVTNRSEQRAEEFVARQKLSGESAARHFDREAEALLKTVNPYLGIVAELVKKHGGTLDKYIGDCVMAFWGAPISNQHHAVCCVRAAIDAQRTVFKLNQRRFRENERRAIENLRRAPGSEPLLPLEILTLGTGINTGIATVGMIGSETHLMNYTVFGREVNLASRLEGASGSARILISDQTFAELLQEDAALAATCLSQPPLSLKGFRDTVTAYEVPWRPSDVTPSEAGQTDIIVRTQEMRDTSY